MHFGQVECKTSRVHASRELELVFGMEREEQDGTESLESQAMWLEVGQAGGMEAEEGLLWPFNRQRQRYG